jgi:hypothetical protein
LNPAIQFGEGVPEHVAVPGILNGLKLVQDTLPRQLQPLQAVELIDLKRGQARPGFRPAFRGIRLLCFDGLALPPASHAADYTHGHAGNSVASCNELAPHGLKVGL